MSIRSELSHHCHSQIFQTVKNKQKTKKKKNQQISTSEEEKASKEMHFFR